MDRGAELLFPNSLTSLQLPWGGGQGNGGTSLKLSSLQLLWGGGQGNGVTLRKLTNLSAANPGRWTEEWSYLFSNSLTSLQLPRGVDRGSEYFFKLINLAAATQRR